MILAIDPGDILSAWIVYDNDDKIPITFAKEENDIVIGKLEKIREQTDSLVIEMIASYGMPVGRSVFETCVWIGKYWQAWETLGGKVRLCYRQEVKSCLCHTMKAKDSNVRQAIMDRYGSSREVAIGKKKTPGPLYGISNDVWAALGVAITASETTLKEDKEGIT